MQPLTFSECCILPSFCMSLRRQTRCEAFSSLNLMPLKRPLLLLVALLLVPLTISVASHTPPPAPWYAASRQSTGLAPDPASVREPVIQVYSAPAYGWRGAFSVHTWIVVKREGATTFTRYDVVGWHGAPFVHENYAVADGYWFGNRPEILLDRRGDGVEAVIDRVEAAVKSYPFVESYRTWPGPNSNTFTAHIGRSVPELRLDLPAERHRQGLCAALLGTRASAERNRAAGVAARCAGCPGRRGGRGRDQCSGTVAWRRRGFACAAAARAGARRDREFEAVSVGRRYEPVARFP